MTLLAEELAVWLQFNEWDEFAANEKADVEILQGGWVYDALPKALLELVMFE